MSDDSNKKKYKKKRRRLEVNYNLKLKKYISVEMMTI